MYTEPTWFATIIAAVLSLVMAAIITAAIIWYLAEERRTEGYSAPNEWAMKSRQNNYEVKFITGGRK